MKIFPLIHQLVYLWKEKYLIKIDVSKDFQDVEDGSFLYKDTG